MSLCGLVYFPVIIFAILRKLLCETNIVKTVIFACKVVYRSRKVNEKQQNFLVYKRTTKIASKIFDENDYKYYVGQK